ncbi:MAG: M48 family metallopeptidase [Methylobacter sp.]|nr:M48 family metallopeptidase [Methylobacter sp.]MDP2098614.1 M48 family metallopeptidase [Methylobacter sp.]MDP2426958.1 M48 family metallopeptidase [Methylobacter sp.]MDP3056185.1 M48 family metallopeptidase [Methylobacter sp.]MDP3360608.1 M48 family metallopeptidase [Methylobacter sp.]
MSELKYLIGYPEHITDQVRQLISDDKLGATLLKKYPGAHEVRTDKALYAYTVELKNDWLKQSQPLSKVIYDDKIKDLHHALGLHTFISRVQGGKHKAKNEIRVASLFKKVPLAFLKMIVVHELAHLKEKDHNKAFYKLCEYMEPTYHQIELDLRLYLTHLELFGALYR